MEVKKNLSKTDQEMFKQFRQQYPGWDIVRYIDNSLVHILPIKESIKNKLHTKKR